MSGLTTGELAEYLEQEPDSRVRVLSPKDGLYEIFPGQNTKALPSGQLMVPNSVVLPMDFPAEPKLETPEEFLKSCIPQIGPRPFQVSVTPETLDVAQPITIEAAPVDKFEFLFLVKPPEGSLQPETQLIGNSLHLVPDQSGEYRVALIGRNAQKQCWLTQAAFPITENAPLLAKTAKIIVDKTKFWHLQNLNWMQYHSNAANARGKGVLVAIIDTGVNYNHPALRSNIHVNSGEIPNNQIDDDENGLVDDVFGYDFLDGDAFPFDNVGHGSHVAALAASSEMGIATEAQILSIRTLGPRGLDLGTVAASILYAVNSGAQIINMSLGWHASDQLPGHQIVERTIALADQRGAVIVAAAGNGNAQGMGESNDLNPAFPASFPNKNIVSVAALDKNDAFTSYSNFGKNSVDIAAPGGFDDGVIVSANMKTANKALWLGMQGTSQASPLVAGALALVKSQHSELKGESLIQHLYSHSKADPALQNKVSTGTRLDLGLLTGQ